MIGKYISSIFVAFLARQRRAYSESYVPYFCGIFCKCPKCIFTRILSYACYPAKKQLIRPKLFLDVNSRAAREQIEALVWEHEGWEYVNDYVGKNAADYKAVIFHDAGHLNFTDLPMISPILAGLLGVGETDTEAYVKNMNEVVLIYFDYYLKEEGSLENIKAEY